MAEIEHNPQDKVVVSKKLLWFFGALVVAQLFLFAFGFYRNLQPKTEIQYIEKPVMVSGASPQLPPITPPQKKRPEISPLPDLPPLPRGFNSPSATAPILPQKFTFDPPVHDPLEERLLKDARTARVKSDMRATALKLGETLSKFPESIHAKYQLADMYEAMGIYDKAIEQYEEVLSLGISVTGPLYEISAKKLKEGFYRESHFGELMAIGTIHQYQDPNITEGQAITVTVPILSSPSHMVDPSQVSVTVSIFDKMNTQVVPALPSNVPECTWSKDPVTWQSNGEEFLIAKYYLPNEPKRGLFSSLEPRQYYGYVIELSYEGELLDQVAWPRILSNKLAGQSGLDLLDFSFEDDSSGINPDNLLLPPVTLDK